MILYMIYRSLILLQRTDFIVLFYMWQRFNAMSEINYKSPGVISL